MKNRKNKLLLLAGLSVMLALAACAPKPQPEQPTQAPSNQPTDNPPENSQMVGDCYNPFNPVVAGRTWTYQTQTAESTDTYTISYEDVGDSSFTSVMEFDEVASRIEWTCSPAGLLSSDFAALNFAQIENMEIETIDVTGVIFPPADKWAPGYSWDLASNVNIKATFEGNTFSGQGNIALTNTIVGAEAISVPAGDYPEAYRVDVTGTVEFSAFGFGTEIPVTYSSWYVKDIGMVKSASTEAQFEFTTELLSLE